VKEGETHQELHEETEKKIISPPQSEATGKPSIPKVLKHSEPDIIIKPKIPQNNIGLNLNPEDFMVKQRPKTVTAVPKDAKNKLKTSPFAHVSNPVDLKPSIPVSPTNLTKSSTPTGFIPPSKDERSKVHPKPTIPEGKTTRINKDPALSPVPVSPTSLIKPKEQAIAPKPIKTPTPATPSAVPQKKDSAPVPTPSGAVNVQQKGELENSLMDLRIKKANITKMSLDFDMKELTGEITPDELETKKQKLKVIESNIDRQIKDLEKLLGK
jgi:hypothetical protein